MKARKIRQRTVTLADDDPEDEGAADALRKSVAARKQQKDRKASKKSTLSFDDDEETQIAPVKRPPAKLKPDLKGLKLASAAAKASTQRSAPGTLQFGLALWSHTSSACLGPEFRSAAGDYSAERLLELQRNTNRLPSSKPAADTMPAAPQPAFKLSGSFRQADSGAAVSQVSYSSSKHDCCSAAEPNLCLFINLRLGTILLQVSAPAAHSTCLPSV